MKQNKLNFLFTIIIVILIGVSGYFIFSSVYLSKYIDNIARMDNNLHVQRDFEIYAALKENNITKIEKNLALNFMFHLKPIEVDGTKYILGIKHTEHTCKAYKKVSQIFKEEYEKKYPKTIQDLDELCK